MTVEEAIRRCKEKLLDKPLDIMDIANVVASVYQEGFKNGIQHCRKEIRDLIDSMEKQL